MTRSPSPTAFLVPIITTLLWTACVPARQYEEMDARYQAMQAEAQAADARAREAVTRADELGSQLEELQRRDRRLEQDTATLGTSLRRMQKQYDKINQLNEELLEKYNQLLAGDRSENRKLLTDLEATRLRLLNKEDSLDALATDLADREAKLAELRAELEKKDEAMRSLKDRISAALTGFEGKGITVEQRQGRIHVSMENKLLFPSGSTVVDAQGKQALKDLAKAIEGEADLRIMVEGHTDTDKVLPGSPYKDNWDLSVMRATSVVRILQDNGRIDPVRITAAGRGEFLPLDPADKARNRRIEIILSPDLTQLYELVTD
ncbi:MAG: OmpA family protein [Flavobacteriales bacterium]|nr:OmpA family protein [Flavobacteriales bacterium]MCB9200736.1 OmpA family protein [Flavobacteriales bacterium]HOP42315.1 OmpA family protein [Flavobacteriales bacterium]HPF66580.1 OmpA family protein [Flavobacteriales bacterium]HPQ57972.1 OmpA family protein [Flavobacteriales bacterium]